MTHNALRRDLSRFATAVAATRAATPGVHTGWQNFKSQLHVHHTVEDGDLWPRLYRAVTDRSLDHAMLKAMEAEHAVLDPMLGRVDATLTNGDQASLSTDVESLAGPWTAICNTTTERSPAHPGRAHRGGLARVWIVDGATPAGRNRFFVIPSHQSATRELLPRTTGRGVGIARDDLGFSSGATAPQGEAPRPC